MTEPRPRATRAENLGCFGLVVLEIYKQANKTLSSPLGGEVIKVLLVVGICRVVEVGVDRVPADADVDVSTVKLLPLVMMTSSVVISDVIIVRVVATATTLVNKPDQHQCSNCHRGGG